jgi:hypothetical protein
MRMTQLPQRNQPKVVMFYRDFRFLTGGHLKVWDYFGHVRATDGYTPRIRFSKSSVMDESNPWSKSPEVIVRRTGTPDVHFVGGLDWLALPPAWRRRRVPVINIIQGVRHGDPGDPRRPFLRYPAVRVCVSNEVAEAVAATGEVRGPMLTIPDGIDVQAIEDLSAKKDIDLLISGLKHRELARSIAGEMPERLSMRVLTDRLPRHEFLALLGRARVALLFPAGVEGFYLPALEAMAAGALVVCPDCIGNRSVCIDGVTSWRPAYQREEILSATRRALLMDASSADRMRAEAVDLARRHSLDSERQSFRQVLDHLPDLWAEALRSTA